MLADVARTDNSRAFTPRGPAHRTRARGCAGPGGRLGARAVSRGAVRRLRGGAGAVCVTPGRAAAGFSGVWESCARSGLLPECVHFTMIT